MIIATSPFKDRNKMNMSKIEINSAKSIKKGPDLYYTL